MSSSSEQFLRLTFNGGRFAEHAMPVEVLDELSAIQKLVREVARHLYLVRHPERKRVPRGFSDAAQLFLSGAEPNCFSANLTRSLLAPDGLGEDPTLFDQARDLILEALHETTEGRPLPREFPGAAIDLVAGLGRRLHGEESLALVGAGKVERRARVDWESRKRLAAIVRRPLHQTASVEGEVEQIDDPGARAFLRTQAGERVEIGFDRSQREALIEALSQRPIARVRVRGQIEVGQTKKLKTPEEFEVVDDERAADVLKCWKRLESFNEIRDGWFEGEGRAPSEHAITRAHDVIARLLVSRPQLARPGIFPTPDGGVQAEWELGSWAVEILFPPEGLSVEAEATQVETDEDREFESSHLSAHDVTPLCQWIDSLV